MSGDLDLLDADLVGFDPMELVRALPGVLKGTGQALDKKAAAPAPPPPPPPASTWSEIGIGWKVGGAAGALLLLVALLKRR